MKTQKLYYFRSLLMIMMFFPVVLATFRLVQAVQFQMRNFFLSTWVLYVVPFVLLCFGAVIFIHFTSNFKKIITLETLQSWFFLRNTIVWGVGIGFIYTACHDFLVMGSGWFLR